MSRFLEALERAEQARSGRSTPIQPTPGAGQERIAHRTPEHRPDPAFVETVNNGRTPANGVHQAAPDPQQELSGSVHARIDPARLEPHLVSLLNPTGSEAEQYRTLRYLVEQKEREAQVKVVGVSSPAKGDGKTTTAINLAASIAQDASMRVLLIDMDLRNPSVSRKLGLSHTDTPGLVSAILNPNIDLGQILIPSTSNLAIIPAGARPASPYEILKARRLSALLTEARSRFDHIIVDAAPLVPFPDCRLMAEIADRILLVVSAHKTPRKLLEEAIKVVPPEKMLGIVYNTDDRFDHKYYYHYAYAHATGKRQSLLGRIAHSVKRIARRREHGA